jgi:hypothetical protein
MHAHLSATVNSVIIIFCLSLNIHNIYKIHFFLNVIKYAFVIFQRFSQVNYALSCHSVYVVDWVSVYNTGIFDLSTLASKCLIAHF